MKEYKALLETIRAEIQAEHTLIFQRMSWYVTSQSFLMSAYAIGGGANEWRKFFMYGMPLLGFVLSYLAYIGISAAIEVQNDLIQAQTEAITELKKTFEKNNDEIAFLSKYAKTTCLARHSRSRFHGQAMWPPKAVPIVFFLTWLGALIYSVFRNVTH